MAGGTQLVALPDMLEASTDALVAIAFNKSTSPSYQVVVGLARAAADYREFILGTKVVHFAAFARSRADAARARALLSYVGGWKGVQVFAGGRLVQEFWSTLKVLDCYLTASGCDDWRAHCYEVMDDPATKEPQIHGVALAISIVTTPIYKKQIEVDQYVFPCRQIFPQFRFEPNHPASPQAQIQAEAVRSGCDWCPNFDAAGYAKAGTRQMTVELFE
jgi:hypothetical protein